MNPKKSNSTRTRTTANHPGQLKKITALMFTAAMLSAASLNVQSQALSGNIAGNIDGALGNGYLVSGDERFEGSANVTVGTTGAQSLVHNFNTVGGAGSGGGAGLGGAFFVDAGASLTVINTDFKSNRVQGGAGGSAPPVMYYDQLVNVTGANVDLRSLPVIANLTEINGVPALKRKTASNGAVSYEFNTVSVSRDSASLIQKGGTARFDNYGMSAKVESVSSELVRLAAPVEASATTLARHQPPVAATNGQTGTTGASGYTVGGDGAVSMSYIFTPGTTKDLEGNVKSVQSAVDIAGLGNVGVGDKLVAGTVSNPVAQVATVTDVVRFTQEEDTALNANGTLLGKVKSFILDKSISTLATNLDVVKQPTFKSIPFALGSATDPNNRAVLTASDSQANFVVGMRATWTENNVSKSGKVIAVNGRTLTLDTAVGANVTDVSLVENPIVGDNKISVANASGKFAVGQAVYVPGTNQMVFEGTVTGIEGNVITIASKTSGQKLADFYDPSLGLALKLPAASVSASRNAITVPFNTTGKTPAEIQALLKDRYVVGASFAEETRIQGVTVGNGSVTLSLNAAVNEGVVESFRLLSPLKQGGSMNNLKVPAAEASQSSAHGGNGFSANFINSFFNDGEGADGTNGAPARDNKGGVGFNGGSGGNGSNGLPINFWLIYDLASATGAVAMASIDYVLGIDELAEAYTDLASSIKELIGVSVPDPQAGLGVTLPDPLEIAAAVEGVAAATQGLANANLGMVKVNMDLTFSIADLVLATANVTKWAVELGRGLAGLGGAGGDGGEASGGADFFGGGAGGAGGVGGAGALSFTDGGSGGAGGRGGDGGFGAGGGQGGPGGKAGDNGNASGGDPGDGGYAGFGAGDGSNGNGMFGGGGDGLGGSIFVREGGTLLIKGNATFARNYVAGGSTSSQFGEAGSEAGTDLFMMKGSNVRLQPGQGKVIQFDGTIADDSFATNDGYPHAAGDGADIRIGGTGGGNGGLVIFNGANTYSGHTILEGATLTAVLGTGVNDMSLIRFNGSGVMTPNLDASKANFNTVSSTMSLDSVGTFLLQEDYVRRAGIDPSETAWTGSGGFASGLSEGVKVTLGAIDDSGRGQQLVWGQDGFFVPFDNGAGRSGVLTFGSELTKGAVEFTNNVNLNNQVGRVAVYNTGDLATSQVTLSGNWGNTAGTSSMLVVGDSSPNSPYTGTVLMTGENSLDSLVVAGGTLSTYNATEGGHAGRLFKSTGDLIVLADKNNTTGSSQISRVHLFGQESLRDMSILGGGSVALAGSLTTSGALTNFGEITILGDRLNVLLDKMGPEEAAAMKAKLGFDYLPEDYAAWGGQMDVGGKFTNYGLITQTGLVKAATLENSGVWTASSDIRVTGDLNNTAKGVMLVTGNVATTTGNVTNSHNWMQAGQLSVGGNLLNSKTGRMNTTGNVIVAGNATNAGVLHLTGDLSAGATLTNDGVWTFGQDATLTAAQLAGTGVFCLSTSSSEVCEGGEARTVTMNLAADSQFDGLLAGRGSLVKTGNASRLVLSGDQIFSGGLQVNGGTVAAMGRMNDALDITIGAQGAYEVHQADTVRSVVNNANGSVLLAADFTATAGLQNHGRLSVVGDMLFEGAAVSNERTLNLGSSGLSGSGTGVVAIAADTNLRIQQIGNSTYAGSFERGSAGSTLTKEGTGSLTLTGPIDLRNVVVSSGELALAQAYILSEDATVSIRAAGQLSLVTGDQKIDQLTGLGTVNLGANNLRLQNGGSFEGNVTGSGQVMVDRGLFNIAGTINSPDSGFSVNSGSITQVEGAGALNVKTLNVQKGGGLKLGTSTRPGGTVYAKATLDISGDLMGAGSITGASIVRAGGRVMPGYSPGVILFNTSLTLERDSLLSMEIADKTQLAGVGFDQVVLGTDAPLNIKTGSQLHISELGNFRDGNLSMGEKLKLFSFNPGKVTGVFGTASMLSVSGNTVAAPKLVLNLATGNVVGLGAQSLKDVAAMAVTPNQRAIYQGLQQGSQGGVGQFYGGRFVENLTSAMANNGSTRAVFDAYSPEVYQSMTDMAQDAAQTALPSWKSGYLGKDGFLAFSSNASKATAKQEDQQAFGIRSNNNTVGYVRALNDKSVMLTFGTVNARTESQLMRSTGHGFNGSVTLLGRFANLSDTTWHVGLGLSNLKLDGQRQNLNGSTSFRDVGTNSTSLETGFETRQNFGSAAYVMGRGTLVLGNAKRDEFTESGAAGGVDAMRLSGLKRSYTQWDAALEVGTSMTSHMVWYGALGIQGGDTNASQMTASFDNQQANISVNTLSALRSNTKVMTGLRYRNPKGTSYEAAIGSTKGWDNKTDLLGRLSVHVPF